MTLLALTPDNWMAICAIAVVVILAFLGLLGRMLYNQGSLSTSVSVIEKKIDKLDDKFNQYIFQSLSGSKSPLTLNAKGLAMFDRPKIQEFVKANFNEILLKMQQTPYESAYQAQEALFSVVDSYKTGSYKINLENEAFETGQHIDILMKVIAIGIRDDVFSKLNLKVENIDNSKPTTPVK